MGGVLESVFFIHDGPVRGWGERVLWRVCYNGATREVSRMRYVLLLRGVNVGGKNKVVMSELKELLRGEGFSDVDSYINSGNLFFQAMRVWKKLF